MERENEDLKISAVLKNSQIKAIKSLGLEVIEEQANCHQASAHYFNQQSALEGLISGASNSMVRPSAFTALRTPIETSSAPSSKFLKKLELIQS